jgi:hypothetical protein
MYMVVVDIDSDNLFNNFFEVEMEKVSIVVDCIVAMIGALSGGGLIFFVQNKRLKELEVKNKDFELYEKADNKCNELMERNQKVRDEQMLMFEQNMKLKEEIGSLKIKIKELEVCKCVKFACTERQPPKMTYVLKSALKDEEEEK